MSNNMTQELEHTLGECFEAGAMIGDKYQLLRKAGEGAMGSVWVAANTALEANVAIKVLRPEMRSPPIAERLLREARAAAKLSHPGIVRVFDLGKTECGTPYIVMELLEGEALRDLLCREQRLTPEAAVAILLPVASAMHAAHERGIVHRDLKPDNVMLTDQGGGRIQTKVVDFGIAKVTWTEPESGATGAAVIGTPQYMPPEQAMGQGRIDHRADIWALCTMLYEAIAGETPYADEKGFGTLRAIVQDPVPSLVERRHTDPALWAIIERGLRKAPAERWASMRELGVALATWLAARGVSEDVCGASLRAQWLDERGSQAPAPSPRPAASSVPTLHSRRADDPLERPPRASARPAAPEAAARRAAPEAAARRAAPEAAARRAAPEVAARRAAPEVAARRAAPEVAARRAAPEVAARKAIEESGERAWSEATVSLREAAAPPLRPTLRERYPLRGVAAAGLVLLAGVATWKMALSGFALEAERTLAAPAAPAPPVDEDEAAPPARPMAEPSSVSVTARMASGFVAPPVVAPAAPPAARTGRAAPAAPPASPAPAAPLARAASPAPPASSARAASPAPAAPATPRTADRLAAPAPSAPPGLPVASAGLSAEAGADAAAPRLPVQPAPDGSPREPDSARCPDGGQEGGAAACPPRETREEAREDASTGVVVDGQDDAGAAPEEPEAHGPPADEAPVVDAGPAEGAPRPQATP
ncbi:serine/threonine-protein kinase [Sorangium sp. So ce1036]|uniref:serine/threonine-protein kinase n=1 Tax=Sorangium sp. So ce1036 TaxID=3133328 RepID=UPI003F08F27F